MRDNTLSPAIRFTLPSVISSAPIYKITQPVVFLPGTLCDERIFMPCWQFLDIPYQAYVPLQWADDLEQMLALGNDRLEYFEEPVHLVGFSLGGYIAALLALAAPQKIASLTLLGSSCQALPAAELTQRKALLAAIKQAKFKGMSDARISAMLHKNNKGDNAIIATVRNMEQDLGMPVLACQMAATSERKNLLSPLAKCQFPVHFVTGEQDYLVSAELLTLAQQQLPNSTSKLIADAGHLLPLEQPQILAEYLYSLLENV
jgi:pimeloyl-ACP methyl ester carboxylesterase